jgi:hypothetical protein
MYMKNMIQLLLATFYIWLIMLTTIKARPWQTKELIPDLENIRSKLEI